MDKLKEGVDVGDATHVKVGGQWHKIKSKWGVDASGRVAAPSKGGFGVVTEGGVRVDMWHAKLYGKEIK